MAIARWSRSGTFAQIRSYPYPSWPSIAGVGREPSLRYAPCGSDGRQRPAGVGREPSLRYATSQGACFIPRAGVGREPSLRYAVAGPVTASLRLESVGNLRSDTLPPGATPFEQMLESVGNLRSDTLPQRGGLSGGGRWSRSGTFAQIRSAVPRAPPRWAGVGREPSLRYAHTRRGTSQFRLESVGNLRSDTL